MNKFLLIVCAALLGLSLMPVASGQETGRENLPVINSPGFAPIVSALKGKTQVPLAIPRSPPKDEVVGEFFGSVTTLKPNEYEVFIGFGAGCNGMPPCQIGVLTGHRVRGKRFMGSPNYYPGVLPRGRQVKLYGGITGCYRDYECAAGCGDSIAYWRQGGYEYMVGIRAEKMSVLIEFANSAIRSRERLARSK